MHMKRVSEQKSRKFTSNTKEEKDIISTMPDDVIGNILSRLNIKEATRTSVLSSKWRYQWTNFSGVLDFDHSLENFQLQRERVGHLRKCMVFLSEWQRFMNNLEHVMKSLKSPSMQGLRICMDLGNPLKVAEWIKFAAAKDVRILELDFAYNFIDTFFEISETTRNVLSSSTCLKMKSLCVLRLVSVDVSGEVIECFLASCPSLETLCVIESQLLVRLRVSGQGLRLKHLELVECNILNLEISAENLLTFRYFGEYGNFNFESVPNLGEASFGGWYGSYLQLNMNNADLYELLSQLLVLKLELSGGFDVGFLEGLPEFNNVKQLELNIHHIRGAELDRPVSLLSAFPSISMLKIKFIRSNLRPTEQQWEANLKHEYPNLRELEVSGYRRDPSQIELLISIFEKAPNLNRIVVDPLSSIWVDRSPDVKARVREMRRHTTKWFVEGLEPRVPPPIELIVL